MSTISQDEIQDTQNSTVDTFSHGSPEKEFVNDLKKIFVVYKKCHGLSAMLVDCFEKSIDPFFVSLSLAYNSFDYNQSKPSSLTYTVLEEFASWIQPRMESLGQLLTENIKMNAFKLASGQKNKTVALLIVNTYQLRESNIYFINKIRDMLENHQYKEACELVKILNLQEHFNIYDFLVPLFLQDKLNVIDEFLIDNTAYQIAFLKFLDSLIIENNLSSKISKLMSDLKMPEAPVNILCKLNNIKALNRYIKRLVGDLNLSKEIVPNYSKRSECKSLSYLVHKRFSDKSLSEESFRELVIDLVKENQEVAKEFLLKLALVGANSEAVYWCQVLNVPITEMPLSVQDYHENITRGDGSTVVESKDDDWEELNVEEFHTLSLPSSAITFVCNETQLLSMLSSEFFNGVPHTGISIKQPDKSNAISQKGDGVLPLNGVTHRSVSLSSSKSSIPSDNVQQHISSDSDSPKKVLLSEEQNVEAQCKLKNDCTEVNQTNEDLSQVVKYELELNKETCVSSVVDTTSTQQSPSKSLLVSGGASLISGAASLVSGGASIVSGGVSLVSGTASLVCSGASVVSGGASLVSSGVSLVTGRASLLSAGASLVSGGASFVSGGSSLVSSGVSLVSGTASVVSGSVNLVSGGASLVSGAAALVAGGVSRVAASSATGRVNPAVEGYSQLLKIYGSVIAAPDGSLVGPGGAYLVALDCEWKPTVGRGKTDLSLLQLATPSSVFILDMISLNSCHQHWDQLVSNLFNNHDVLKIGFSLHTDMMYLSTYFDCDYSNFGCNLLDLADLWFKLSTEYHFVFPFTDESQENSNSLSRLVYLCLGKNLDKKERFSNWELRPLRETQIQYAALDSFCLIEVYNVLRHLCTKRGLPFDDIVNEVVQKYGEKISKKKKKFEDAPRREKEVKVLNAKPISVDGVSLICDKSVMGLAKKLRRCGISADTVDPDSSPKELIEKAQKENKVILVKGNSFIKMKESLPQNQVYKIKTLNPDSQFIEVLNYFNFSIKNEDIFSRCLECNSNCMEKCTREVVESWHTNTLEEAPSSSTFVPAGFEDEVLQDDYDEFYEDCHEDDYIPSTSVQPVLKPVSTKLGCPIKVDVPDAILKRVNSFYLCQSCGKIYWNEGQFDQILGTLNSSFVSP